MDWIKCKVEHILSDEFTDSEIGALYRYQAKVAFHERFLTKKERKSILSDKKVATLSEKLETIFEKSLEKVARKVLEDVEKVQNRSEKKLKNKQDSRLKAKNVAVDVTPPCRHDDDGQIRLDKIRLDKSNTPIPSLVDPTKRNCVNVCPDPLNFVPKPRNELAENMMNNQAQALFRDIYHKRWDKQRRGKLKEALLAFKANVDTTDFHQLEDLKIAFDNYCSSDQVDRKVIMKVSTWLEQWGNYLPETTEKELKNEAV